MTPDTRANRPTYSTERLGALSDGVFSIVLTLLVLDLKAPTPTTSASTPRSSTRPANEP